MSQTTYNTYLILYAAFCFLMLILPSRDFGFWTLVTFPFVVGWFISQYRQNYRTWERQEQAQREQQERIAFQEKEQREREQAKQAEADREQQLAVLAKPDADGITGIAKSIQ